VVSLNIGTLVGGAGHHRADLRPPGHGPGAFTVDLKPRYHDGAGDRVAARGDRRGANLVADVLSPSSTQGFAMAVRFLISPRSMSPPPLTTPRGRPRHAGSLLIAQPGVDPAGGRVGPHGLRLFHRAADLPDRGTERRQPFLRETLRRSRTGTSSAPTRSATMCCRASCTAAGSDRRVGAGSCALGFVIGGFLGMRGLQRRPARRS